MPTNRRRFITSVGALAGASLLPDLAEARQNPQGWDLAFTDRFTGKHKQVFDVMDTSLALIVIKNWLDAWESVYGLKHPDVNAIGAMAGKGFVINASDAMYSKFPIGRLFNVNDPATNQPVTRSPFVAAQAALQARGVVFWMCNNALNAVAGRVASAVQRPQPEVYQELRAGLNPGVIVVPAHTMLVGIVQEKGFTYEAV